MTTAEEQVGGPGRFPLIGHLLRASALYGVAGAVGKAGALITVPIVTRALGPDEYGLLDLSITLIALATLIGGLSAELPAARLAADHPTKRASILTTYLATVTVATGLLAVALYVGHDATAEVVWQQPSAGPLVAIASVAVFLTAIQLATWNIHRLQDRPRAYALLSTADMILKVTLIVIAALVGNSADAVVFVYLLVAAVGAVAGLWSVRQDLRLEVASSVIPSMLRGGAIFTVIAVAFVASGYAVRAILSAGAGASAVGEMGVAVRLASVLALPLAAFQFAWAPPSMAAGPSPASRRMFRDSTIGVLLVGGFAALVLAGFSSEAVTILAGGAFAPAAAAVPGLAVSTVLATGFFMLGVAASVAQIRLSHAALAAVIGASLQVLVTSIAFSSLGEQAAVGTGALVGYEVAILLLIAASRGMAVERSGLIAVVTVAMTLAAVVVQVTITLDLSILRWAIGAVSAASLFVVTIRYLPPRSGLARGRSSP